VTGFRLLDVGNIIHPPTTQTTGNEDALVVVAELQPTAVVFSLSTQNLPEIQSAIAATQGPLQAIAFSQDGKTELDRGALLVVNNQADPGSGTFQFKAQFPNQKRQLWPGAFVNVQLVRSTVKDGLTIPLDAVEQGRRGQ
jgi:membrane fusion protein, multidrug efflux system